jgi:hypothetical protein
MLVERDEHRDGWEHLQDIAMVHVISLSLSLKLRFINMIILQFNCATYHFAQIINYHETHSR